MSTSQSFIKRFKTNPKPLVLDGAMGTELERRGVNVNDKLWSGLALINNPDKISQLYQAYLKAGADIITTATYQLSTEALKERGLNQTDVYDSAIKVGVDSKKAFYADNANDIRQVYIGGSVGPYGAFLADGSEYTGSYRDISQEELAQFHEFRLKYLFESPQVDFIAFETIPKFEEIKVLVNAIKKLNFKSKNPKPYTLSMTCNDGETLADGSSFTTVLQWLNVNADEWLVAMGSNCCRLLHSLKIINTINSSLTNCETLKQNNVKIIMPDLG
ncbi:unnamed protein product [Ambrosiozyma monospora]|uniref:Unnamed protein product n=1 Tax=Ambrosiozyma monospora TaxID=43982 RepID=A0ACB5SSL5_AMBMO|nr:unnamed protein product [Ambrosiozyma monospora]